MTCAEGVRRNLPLLAVPGPRGAQLRRGSRSPCLPTQPLAEERTIAHVPRVTPNQYALTAEVQA